MCLEQNAYSKHTFLWGMSSKEAWYTCLVLSGSYIKKFAQNIHIQYQH